MVEMTNVKTWSKTRLEGTGASNLIANKDLFWKIKEHFKTVGWSVVSSSNGATDFGNSDFWLSGADIVIAVAGSNHSWIVLGNNSICTGFQVCIDFSNTSNAPREAYWYISSKEYGDESGFAGGSLTARPTADDEAIMNVYNDEWTYYSSGTEPSANVWSSSDNQNYTVFLGPTTVRGVWAFGRAVALKSFWTKPCYAMVASGGTGSATYSWHNDFTNNWTTTIIENKTIRMYLGTIMIGSTYPTSTALTSAGVAGATGDANGAWPATPVWLISSSPYYPGILGIIPDLWWLHSNATLAIGDTFPADDSKQQVVIGNFGVGNDGSALTL